MYALKSMPSHQEHLLRQERLCFDFSITANATPANKQHQVDMVGVVILRMQGQIAAADAIEEMTWTAPVDNSAGNSIFGVLLNLGGHSHADPNRLNHDSDDDRAQKVYSVTVIDRNGTATSIAVTGPNGSSSFLTPFGNIAFEIAGLALNLASESPQFTVVVEYLENRN